MSNPHPSKTLSSDGIVAAQIKSAGPSRIEANPSRSGRNNPTGRSAAGNWRGVMSRFVAMAAVAGAFLFASPTVSAQPEEGQYYQIKNVRSKKTLAIDDEGAKVEGAQIVQRIAGPNPRQEWKFEKVGRYYKIINRKSGMALNVQNASKAEGTPIIQWDASDPGENQQWLLEKHGENYVLKARHSGLVLDVSTGTKKRKAELLQYSFQNSGNQIFALVPVKK